MVILADVMLYSLEFSMFDLLLFLLLLTRTTSVVSAASLSIPESSPFNSDSTTSMVEVDSVAVFVSDDVAFKDRNPLGLVGIKSIRVCINTAR